MERRGYTAPKQLSTLAATLAGLLMVGCASAPPTDPAVAAYLNPDDIPVVTPESVEHSLGTYRAAEVAQGALLLGRVSLVESLIRPFSTEKALISLVLKSSLGFAQRVAIGTVRFQALEAKPIPAIVPRPGMDLDAWEADLAGLAGTSTRGTVRFLIDGDEFFPRLIETVRDADESIDIRTYIFDNDDYAVKFADLLKGCLLYTSPSPRDS